MADNQTLARPYAKAAFELANEQQLFAKWSEMLALAASIANDSQIIELLKNPNFSMAQTIALFLELGKNIFSEAGQNFIRILAEFKRLPVLPEIALGFEQLRAQAERMVNVEVTCALPLDDEYQQRLIKALAKRTGCDISLTCAIDESILGGAIVRAGDVVIDGSIRGRLAKLSDAIGVMIS